MKKAVEPEGVCSSEEQQRARHPDYHCHFAWTDEWIAQHPPLSSSSKGGTRKRFTTQLYRMLEEVNGSPHSLVIQWLPHGRAFVVLDKDRFVSEVLPVYFPRQNEYRSFQRQLNIYGFLRLSRQENGYYHERFLRSRFVLSTLVPRIMRSQLSTREALDPFSEPNFDSMPWLPGIICHIDKSTVSGIDTTLSLKSLLPPPFSHCSSQPAQSPISFDKSRQSGSIASPPWGGVDCASMPGSRVTSNDCRTRGVDYQYLKDNASDRLLSPWNENQTRDWSVTTTSTADKPLSSQDEPWSTQGHLGDSLESEIAVSTSPCSGTLTTTCQPFTNNDPFFPPDETLACQMACRNESRPGATEAATRVGSFTVSDHEWSWIGSDVESLSLADDDLETICSDGTGHSHLGKLYEWVDFLHDVDFDRTSMSSDDYLPTVATERPSFTAATVGFSTDANGYHSAAG